MAVYRRTLQYYRPFVAETLAGAGLGLIAVALNLLKPWPVKWIIDGVLVPGDGDSPARRMLESALPESDPVVWIAVLCGLIVGIHFLWGAANLGADFLFVRVGLKALLAIRTQLYAYLQSLPLKFHDTSRSSDSSFRVAYDTMAVQTIYNRGMVGVFTSVVMLVGVFVVMVRMDVLLALVSLAVVPFLALTIRHFASRIRSQSAAIHERESAVLDAAQEGLRSVRLVHAFGREADEVGQFRQRAHQSLSASLRFNITNVASTMIAGTLMAIGTAAMFYIGANHVLNGTLQIGDLVVFAAYLTMLYGPIESLAYTAWALEGAAAGAARCFEVLDREDDVPDAPDAVSLPEVRGRISLEGVSFHYAEDRPTLEDLDLDIPAGQITAIVGGTGAGKSTLLGLIPRFYDPSGGRVLVDGQDIRRVTKQSLRARISMVLQDTLLFSSSVRENIAYGRPDAGFEEIVEAARRAEAHDFIERMAGGYDAHVGERGNHLSAGQRQRIGIARAFLRDSPILLLDEPTSALDPSTEASVLHAMRQLMAGRTTVLVTHRVATVHDAHRIVVLENGRIVEAGTGPDLLRAAGIYARFYRMATQEGSGSGS